MADDRYKNPREHCQFAQTLRKQASPAEQMLWQVLAASNKNTSLKFRRQHPIHPYIADFACVKARLIIELDGSSHDMRQIYDARRDDILSSKGWTILRFSNDEIYKNLEGVVDTIMIETGIILALP